MIKLKGNAPEIGSLVLKKGLRGYGDWFLLGVVLEHDISSCSNGFFKVYIIKHRQSYWNGRIVRLDWNHENELWQILA